MGEIGEIENIRNEEEIKTVTLAKPILTHSIHLERSPEYRLLKENETTWTMYVKKNCTSLKKVITK